MARQRVKRPVRGSELRGQLEGLRDQREGHGSSQSVREASQGVCGVWLGGEERNNGETEKRRKGNK